MNKYWKDKWITALRSGEYKQTKNCLKNNEGYCCLGVLSDLVAKEYPDKYKWQYEEDNKIYSYISFNEFNRDILLQEVIELTEVPDQFGTIDYNICLTMLNDNGCTFEQIAAIIEENY